MTRALRALPLALAVASGCAAPGEPVVEVGVGLDAFRPVEDGAVLLLARGCQGAQHVWVAVRCSGIGLGGESPIVDFTLATSGEGELVSAPLRTRTGLSPVPGEPYGELAGLALVVPEPDGALGEPLDLRVEVRADGARGVDARAVSLEWGMEVCGE